jgi:hypothetical protein
MERYEAASSSVPTDNLATSQRPSFLRALFLWASDARQAWWLILMPRTVPAKDNFPNVKFHAYISSEVFHTYEVLDCVV